MLIVLGQEAEGNVCMCRLPSADIFPVVRVDSSGSTELVTNYLATDPSWALAVGKSIAWPKCTQQVQGSDGILNYIAAQKNAIGCAFCKLPWHDCVPDAKQHTKA